MPAPIHIEIIEGILRDIENPASFALFEMWRGGDEQTLLTHIVADADRFGCYEAQYMDAVLTQRGNVMLSRALQFMSEDKNVFFVVGVAHTIGEGGLINSLSRLGYTVERIE